jgi:hypothetical protein
LRYGVPPTNEYNHIIIIIRIIIIGATGTILKPFRQYLSNVLGKYEIKELLKSSHIGHCTHTMECSDARVQNLFHGRNNIACSTDCKYRTAATPYTLETCFVAAVQL